MQSSLSLKSLVLAIGLVLTAAAPAVFAQGHPMPARHAGFDGHHLFMMLDDVNASEAQRGQIEAIFKSAREDLKSQHEQGLALRKQMLQAFGAANVDAAQIEALRKQQSALHETASQRMSRAMVEAARVLTPEQRAQIAAKITKRMERMRQHGHHPA